MAEFKLSAVLDIFHLTLQSHPAVATPLPLTMHCCSPNDSLPTGMLYINLLFDSLSLYPTTTTKVNPIGLKTLSSLLYPQCLESAIHILNAQQILAE